MKKINYITFLTSDNLSNLANNSFNILTNSCAEYVDEIAVNPTISAYKILKQRSTNYFYFAHISKTVR